MLFVEGSRNDYGFSLDITLRGVAGEDTEKAQGWCNFCTGPQMVTAAENVARPLVVHLAARPERVPGGVAAAPGASTGAAAEGNGGSGLARVLLGAGVAAVGAAGIVAGSFTWHRAGTETDCFIDVDGRARLHVDLRGQESRHWNGGRRRYSRRRGRVPDDLHGIEDARRGGSRRRVRGGNVLVSRLSFAIAFALMLATVACNPKSLKHGLLQHNRPTASVGETCNPDTRKCDRRRTRSVDQPEVGRRRSGRRRFGRHGRA